MSVQLVMDFEEDFEYVREHRLEEFLQVLHPTLLQLRQQGCRSRVQHGNPTYARHKHLQPFFDKWMKRLDDGT